MKKINIGLLGLGVVGSGVFKNLHKNADVISQRVGVSFDIRQIAVRNIRRHRGFKTGGSSLTCDAMDVARDPSIQIVVELIGNTDIARQVILEALRRGKTVVTANKTLLAMHGEELLRAAQESGAGLFFEASVCGGIPIIKVLREGLVANRFQLIYGIVNGTCNYILSQMTSEGKEFHPALSEAQRLGYAEADPSMDIDGKDAAQKAAILASLAHGFWMRGDEVYVEGIRRVTQLDIRITRELGYRIKQLAIIKSVAARGRAKSSPAVEVRVHPTLIPQHHVLASVNGPYNAVVVRGDVVGETMYYGRGAGSDATSSAVIADLVDAARSLAQKRNSHAQFSPAKQRGRVIPIDDVASRYYLRLTVEDRAGVVAQVAKILGDADISIASVLQPEAPEPKRGRRQLSHVPLIMMLHTAQDRRVQDAVTKINKLAVVKERTCVIRVENFE